MTQETAGQFDELAILYEDMATWPFRKEIEIPSVLAALGDVRGLDLLDFGCGTGMYVRSLKARGAARVVGYDLSQGMLNYARRRAEKESLDIAFMSSLGEDLTGQFDVVLAVYVLPYARTPGELQSMCADMARLLRPGGRLITLPIHPEYSPSPSYYEPYGFRLVADDPETAPYIDGGRVRLDLCFQHYQTSVDAWYWSDRTLKAALGKAGFTAINTFNPYAPACPDISKVPTKLRAYLDRPHAVVIDATRG
ncbi:class I SAM-dependent methyltransferase [Paraburkholderia humisilvae]|uniref:2-methoxy-6-polyprenyl-1,4-benzoquinol methylase, mitochondrial n=1 Tax=Paraburkholderia humisilvae TaxID=627669 RepID=A0A6J5FBG6_9BURK|nr:class I SAM-dependent methyltransferase [Paraburkholderia humisilvae]CAB3774555.1 2-methoxy-6-polyprenyl-1,4-benzoquinol methylase, mitochondrial [Paraburkholderia humisilvae]